MNGKGVVGPDEIPYIFLKSLGPKALDKLFIARRLFKYLAGINSYSIVECWKTFQRYCFIPTGQSHIVHSKVEASSQIECITKLEHPT